jgi:hypothetical protein
MPVLLSTHFKPLVEKFLCLIKLLQAHQRHTRSEVAFQPQARRRDLDDLSTENCDLEEKMQANPVIEKPYKLLCQLHTPKGVALATD